MLVGCCATAYDAGPALNQHWTIVLSYCRLQAKTRRLANAGPELWTMANIKLALGEHLVFAVRPLPQLMIVH